MECTAAGGAGCLGHFWRENTIFGKKKKKKKSLDASANFFSWSIVSSAKNCVREFQGGR